MKKLKTLSEHNSEASKTQATSMVFTPILNGIACPKCGKELLDSQPNIILTSNPSQKNTCCSNKKCDYTGYRIV